MKHAFFIFTLLMLSCTSKIAVNTSPTAANVYVDNEFQGVTPVEASLDDFSDSARLRIEKDGYETEEIIVSKQYQTTYGIGTAYTYTPGIGMTSGFGNSYQTSASWPSQVYFVLRPKYVAKK